jgi:hypothetical protein
MLPELLRDHDMNPQEYAESVREFIRENAQEMLTQSMDYAAELDSMSNGAINNVLAQLIPSLLPFQVLYGIRRATLVSPQAANLIQYEPTTAIQEATTPAVRAYVEEFNIATGLLMQEPKEVILAAFYTITLAYSLRSRTYNWIVSETAAEEVVWATELTEKEKEEATHEALVDVNELIDMVNKVGEHSWSFVQKVFAVIAFYFSYKTFIKDSGKKKR